MICVLCTNLLVLFKFNAKVLQFYEIVVALMLQFCYICISKAKRSLS